MQILRLSEDTSPVYATASLMLAAFMSMLDATIVNLALPAIQSEFKSGANELQWVLVVYVLTFAAGLLPFGRFGDVFGRRRIFLFGLSGFVVSSLGAGLAPSITVLIAVRAVQGLAAAAMVPQVLALIHTLFPAETRGRAIGYFGMVNALGAIAGPTIGGALISADTLGLGWRLIFLVNLPVGLLAIAGALAFLPKNEERLSMKADWIGAGCFAIVISCLVYPLIEGRSAGWPTWMTIYPMVSVGFAFAFWQRQQRLEQLERIQTLPLELMRDPRYVISVGSVMVLTSGLAGIMVVLAVYLQMGVGLSPAAAGFAIAPHPVSAMIASVSSGQLGARYLKVRVLVSLCAISIGLIWLRFISGAAASGIDILGPLILLGSGAGAAFVALFQLSLQHVSATDAGAGAGALQAFQQVGIALGIAVTGQLFFARIEGSSSGSYPTAIDAALSYPIGVSVVLCLYYLFDTIIKRKRHEIANIQ